MFGDPRGTPPKDEEMAKTQKIPAQGAASLDPIWTRVRAEAEAMAACEPALASFAWETVLNHSRLEDAIVHRVAERLGHPTVKEALIRQTWEEALADAPEIGEIFRVDLQAVFDRDPACERLIEPILYFKGFHAIQTHRLAHWLWQKGRQEFALYLQSRSSEVFQVDIHPQVPLGRGLFFDHATGIVIGATATIDDDVSILQGVTLGGTGKETGDRHPKIGRGVLLGAGAKVLGNIMVGQCARVASGSVVLHPVPPRTTVAGVPARVVGEVACSEPARAMDQMLADD
jgi:serine O-acetyltransferase